MPWVCGTKLGSLLKLTSVLLFWALKIGYAAWRADKDAWKRRLVFQNRKLFSVDGRLQTDRPPGVPAADALCINLDLAALMAVC